MYSFFFIILFISSVFHVHEGFALSAPLSTEGNQIVDQEKKAIRIQGISWFGFETDHFVLQGLDIRSYRMVYREVPRRAVYWRLGNVSRAVSRCTVGHRG